MKKLLATLGLMLLASAAFAETGTVTITMTIRVQNQNYTDTRSVTKYTKQQNADHGSAVIQSIQTNAWEQLTIAADVATNGYTFARCLSTNKLDWVDIGTQITVEGTNFNVALLRLEGGGDPMIVQLHPTNSVYALAGSTWTNNEITGVNLEFRVNEH